MEVFVLKEDRKRMRNRVKILILGCGKAGKVLKSNLKYTSY
jgi:hypothetical protein